MAAEKYVQPTHFSRVVFSALYTMLDATACSAQNRQDHVHQRVAQGRASLVEVCSSSYVSLAQDRATAVAKFADFWASNKDGECRSEFVVSLTAGARACMLCSPNLAVDWVGGYQVVRVGYGEAKHIAREGEATRVFVNYLCWVEEHVPLE